MKQIEETRELREQIAGLRGVGSDAGPRRIGFVPTMGSLHRGHMSLVARAREECGAVVASVYVNPTQFGPGEDFDAYPRQLESDAALCEQAGVDLLYVPCDESMYPEGFSTFVHEELLSMPLCGHGRPGHFRGVCTVVTKLLCRVLPDVLYLGQKDAQQALVVRRMARDLDLPVEVRVCPIVRDEDGLALSSRNQYLDADTRIRALALSRALRAVEQSFLEGERKADTLLAAGRRVLEATEGVETEYLELVEVETLAPVPTVESNTLVAVAARVGGTRLIDNLVLDGASGRVLAHL